jgi:hypothetical protein
MTRGIGDPAPLPEEEQGPDEETQQVIRELIMGQNKLHDRIIDLERKFDHLLKSNEANETGTSRHRRRGANILGL